MPFVGIGNILGGGSAKIPYAKKLAKAYEARVIADGGVVESLGCFTAFATALGAFKPTLLLDFYQNAAAAYSLRKLSTTYTGDAIRVRRASDNTELNIGFVNNVLDTASLTTFCSGTDGFVTTWYDQSGNAVNATETTANNQPKIVSSGSVILQNNKPTIKSGVLGVLNNLSVTLSVLQPFSVCGVITTPLDRDQVPYSSRNTIVRNYRRFGTSNNFLLQAGVNLFYGTENFNQTLDIVAYDGANSFANINGLLSVSGDVGTDAIDNFNIFNNANSTLISHQTSIQELIIFDYNISSDVSNIETNINNFYSIY